MDDCQDTALLELESYFGLGHLSDSAHHKTLFQYPIRGLVKTIGERCVIPMRVQSKSKGSSCDIVVYFVVDTGSPYVTFSENTCKKIIGSGNSPLNVLVQGTYFPFQRSKWFNEAFKDVNFLGTDFFLQSNTSLIFSPFKFVRPGMDNRIFYICPLGLMGKVQKLASTPNQNPSMYGNLGLENRTEEIRDFETAENCSEVGTFKKVRSISDIRQNSAYLQKHVKFNETPMAHVEASQFKSNDAPAILGGSLKDSEDSDLLCYGDLFGVHHLSDCEEPSLFDYPVRGIVKTHGNRCIIPLRVQTAYQDNTFDTVVYFVVDTGASDVSFSSKTYSRLVGNGTSRKVFIQDEIFQLALSEKFRDDLKDVNLLGGNFFAKTRTSLIFSPNSYYDPHGLKYRIFYLAPFSMIASVKILAEQQRQNANLFEKNENYLLR